MRLLFVFLLASSFICESSTSQGYPEAYVNLGLPQYSQASITDLSRTTDNLRDGIKIFLESASDYATLRSYYESELAALGWTLNESIAVKKMREMGVLDQMPFIAEFSKGNMKYNVFTNRVNDITKITLTVVEN